MDNLNPQSSESVFVLSPYWRNHIQAHIIEIYTRFTPKLFKDYLMTLSDEDLVSLVRLSDGLLVFLKNR